MGNNPLSLNGSLIGHASLRNNLKELFEFVNGGFTPCKVNQDSLGFWIARCGLGIPCRWNLDFKRTMDRKRICQRTKDLKKT